KAGGRFLEATKGEAMAEEKRKKFRETFYQVLGEEARKDGCDFVVQGTIAPDWIETQGGIKTQHNILEQVGIDSLSKYGFRVVEPISELYKDQVRVLGRHLDLPKDMSERQPFPGPGLLVRCIGTVSKKKLDLLKSSTKIVEEKLGPFNYDQYFAGVIENRFAREPVYKNLDETAAGALGLPSSETRVDVFEDRVTGVKGDTRSYGRLAGIRIQEDSRETYGWLPEKLRLAQSSIVEKFVEVTRVAVTSMHVVYVKGQYNHLIARRLQELGVDSHLMPPSTPLEKFEAMKADALVMGGGPQSVRSLDALTDELRDASNLMTKIKLPMLCICVTHQLIATTFGGTTNLARKPEFGPVE